MDKTYTLRPGTEHNEDRTIEITETIPDSVWESLPDYVKNAIPKEQTEKYTVGNLKIEHAKHIDNAKREIEESNKKQKIIEGITDNVSELNITGKPIEIIGTDLVEELDNKKPKLRENK